MHITAYYQCCLIFGLAAIVTSIANIDNSKVLTENSNAVSRVQSLLEKKILNISNLLNKLTH